VLPGFLPPASCLLLSAFCRLPPASCRLLPAARLLRPVEWLFT